MKMAVRLLAAKIIANMTRRDEVHELLVQLSQGQRRVVQYDATSTMSMKRGYQRCG